MKIIIDNIRSANNIGSLFRTADAFAIDKIYLCGISATPPNKEILKTALGSTESVKWEYHPDTLNLVSTLKQDPLNFIVAVEQAPDSVPLHTFVADNEKNIILILGNEVEGVAADILKLVDAVVEIPQFGIKKSLNVSVAGGIAVWEIFKKLKL